jgi:hypothetical protein
LSQGNAQAKGRTLGIFKPHEEKAHKARKKKPGETFLVEVCGRTVPAINTEEGIRAAIKGRPISPVSVERYLQSKFGDDLEKVRKAMEKLANAYSRYELAERCMGLYEQFRPQIPAGEKGWGAAGDLDPDFIFSLAPKR